MPEAVWEAVWEGMRWVVVWDWVEEDRVSHGELSVVVELAGSSERDCSRLFSESLDETWSESKWWPPLTLLSSVSLPWLRILL